MINTQIILTEQTYDSLQAITKQTGKTCEPPDECGKIVKIYLTLNKYVARGSV